MSSWRSIISFFFHKQIAPRREAVKPIAQPSRKLGTLQGKRNVEALNAQGCSACQLQFEGCKTPKMEPTLASTTEVYFLAEAPGFDEDEHTHKPLTGPSGKLLRSAIPKGLEAICSFDNIVNCRPPENRNPTWQETESCRPRRIKWIEQTKPKLIVGLGLIPLQAMLGSSDMVGMRGRFFSIKIGAHRCWFMPTYHPSFILRVAKDKKKPLNGMMGGCFKMDIERAFNRLGTLGDPVVDSEAEVRANIECFDGRSPGQLATLLNRLTVANRAPLKAIDLETEGLRPYSANAAVLTAAVSHGAVNFSFAIDHPQAGWSPDERKQLLSAFEALLKNKNTIKIAHNVPFELEWLIWLYDRHVADHTTWECTQMGAHFADERKGKQSRGEDERRAAYQSLNFLIKQYFGVSYKALFKLDKKHMSKSDLTETLIYNAVDTKYTLKLFHLQVGVLRAVDRLEAYYDSLPRQVSVALMQSLGMEVSQGTVSAFQAKIGEEIKGIKAEILALPDVQEFIKKTGEYNPDAPKQTLELFRDHLNVKEVVIQDKGKERHSVDEKVLSKIDHPLAALTLKLRNRSKLKSVYIDSLQMGVGDAIYPDGKIHTNFNCTFTETGRTSSDSPNLQNFPSRKDSWVREEIVAGKGKIILAFDYGQLEACAAAMCSKDKVLVDALWKDYDIHMEWSERLVKVYPQAGTPKDIRSLIKNKLVFPAMFGAQNSSITSYLNQAEIKVPEETIDSLMEDFWSVFSGLKSWQDSLMKAYYEKGTVSSFNGRVRHYPLTRNQVINHPIQCLGAEIVCHSMNRLSAMALEADQWHLHPRLNIHDDISLVIPDDDVVIEDTIKTVSEILLHPPYSCINVPLSVSPAIGYDWFHMEKLDKIWSHK